MNVVQNTSRPRVGLFQAFDRFHSNTVFMAVELERAGFSVDIFALDVIDIGLLGDDGGLSREVLSGEENIHFHKVSSQDKPRGAKSGISGNRIGVAALRKGRSLLARSLPGRARKYLLAVMRPVIPANVIGQTANVLKAGQFHALIGIDKGGLAWAAEMHLRYGVPLIYWSLELYTRDHPFCATNWGRHLKAIEERRHRQCVATIVQDEERGKVLLKDNNVDCALLYLPISRRGAPITTRSNYLQERLNLNGQDVVLLYYGLIAERRFCRELVESAQFLPPDQVLVFHGVCFDSYIERLKDADKRRKTRFSLELVELSKEPTVVGSAHISLTFYRDLTVNEFLCGFASEKIALSLQCGVPVIAFDYPSCQHIKAHRAGVLIKDFSELSFAIEEILRDHESYRAAAFEVYEKYYRFERNVGHVISKLKILDLEAA